MFSHRPHDDVDYIGEATVIICGTEITVQLELKGYREPIDGIFRWIGRIKPNAQLTAIVGVQSRVRATIRTAHSAREALIGDRDPWNRYRVIGRSTPPFHVPTEPPQAEDSDRL